MADIGPVQLVIAAFGPDARYEGKIMDEIERIERSGAMRVLDVLFVQKGDDGALAALDVQGHQLGGMAGALLGFEFEFAEGGGGDVPQTFIDVDTVGISRSEILDLGEALEPGHAVGLVLIQHVWARDLARAIDATGGTVLRQDFLARDALAEISPELLAMAEAMDREAVS